MLLQKNTQGGDEYFAIINLFVDREAGVARVTLGCWAAVVAALRRTAPISTLELDVHFGVWAPDMAITMLSLCATLPEFNGSVLIEE